MKKQLTFLAFLFLIPITTLFAQVDSTETDEDNFPLPWVKASDEGLYRMGIKMGFQVSTFFMGNVQNNQPMVGLQGGGFGRINFKKGWSLQHEAFASFHGSNFYSNPGGVSAIKLITLDIPVILYKKTGIKSPHRIGAGVEFSHMLNSSIYQDSKSYPSGKSPALNKNDWSALIAYQYQLEYVALQGVVKYGFRDLNLYKPWPGNDNVNITNNMGTLNNFAIQFNLIF